MSMDSNSNISSYNYTISQSIMHSLDLSNENFFGITKQEEEKIAMFKFKSFNGLSISTHIKYLTYNDVIIIKELIILSYHIETKQKAFFVLPFSDLKVQSKSLKMAMSFAIECITFSHYLLLITVSNSIHIISIKEDKNNKERLSYEIIYENKKLRSIRCLILGTQIFENEVLFYMITKKENQIVSISCSIDDNNINQINVICNEKSIESNAKYEYCRFTQSTCKWTLFTEKKGENIMLDKHTLMTYPLICANDLANHSYFLMNNDEEDQLYLITDLEEEVNETNDKATKCLYLYFFQLLFDKKENKFKSTLIEKIHVINETYEKYVLVGFNDCCFFVNFYTTFITYYFDKTTKKFIPFKFEADNHCEITQSFTFNTFNDKNNKTHIVLETYKEERLVLIDYVLQNEHLNGMTDKRRIKKKVRDIESSNMYQLLSKDDEKLNDESLPKKISKGTQQKNIDCSYTMIRQKNCQIKKVPRYNHDNDHKTNDEELINTDNKDNQSKQINDNANANDSEQQKTSPKQPHIHSQQNKYINEQVNKIIDTNHYKISQKIVSKYSQLLQKLDHQTHMIEMKQNDCNKTLDLLLSKLKKKKEQEIKNNKELENEYSVEIAKTELKQKTCAKLHNSIQQQNQSDINKNNINQTPLLSHSDQLGLLGQSNKQCDQLDSDNINMNSIMNVMNQILNMMKDSFEQKQIKPLKIQSFDIISVSKEQQPKQVSNQHYKKDNNDTWLDEDGNSYIMKKVSKDYIYTFDDDDDDFGFVKVNNKKKNPFNQKKIKNKKKTYYE